MTILNNLFDPTREAHGMASSGRAEVAAAAVTVSWRISANTVRTWPAPLSWSMEAYRWRTGSIRQHWTF